MRPKNLVDVVGHGQYLSESSALRNQIKSSQVPSLILWGPPGVGKTTLARVIANELQWTLNEISAVSAGVKEVKEIISKANEKFMLYSKPELVFIDEIHRFNKAQQDALLHATEKGIIILIGATTENPSFEVNPALISRCTVLKLGMLDKKDLTSIVNNALEKDLLLKNYTIKITDMDALIFHGSGDARKTLNLLEASFVLADKDNKHVVLDRAVIEKASAEKTLSYDKKSDYHYDTISAFIKSVRGSDPDAGVYWLARMLDAGEDPVFIARRLVILASEDVGNAEPYSLSLANAGFDAVKKIGMPEARIILAQVTTYLASVPKSNAAYVSIDEASRDLKKFGILEVPLHLRNAPTALMKEMKYGSGYKYVHDFDNNFSDQQYLPNKLKNKVYYQPTENGREKGLKEYLKKCWPKKRNKG